MLPLPAAFMALRAAGTVVRGIHALRANQQSQPQPTPRGPQAQRGPDLSNAPRFAEVMGQQTSIRNADAMARTVADRLVKVSHRPMRSDAMQNFIQTARKAFIDLSKGVEGSEAVNDFKHTLRGRLEMTQPQIDQVMAQFTSMARGDQVDQSRFLLTGGSALTLDG